MKKYLFAGLALAAGIAAALPLAAQVQGMYPPRPTDPAAVARGKELFVNNSCSFCHGADIRGGDGGPSLQRSAIVLSDQRGEKIGPIIRHGVPGTRMPAFDMTDAQIADIAEFLHSFKTSNGGDPSKRPETVVVGDPAAGQAYFQKTCSGCHSPTGDLAGIATRIPDGRNLQQAWLAPRLKSPVTAKVTFPDGQVVNGTPIAVDEFSLTLVVDGQPRTIERRGDTPKVEISNPLAPHVALLRKYTDKDIHDVTAYLVTLK